MLAKVGLVNYCGASSRIPYLVWDDLQADCIANKTDSCMCFVRWEPGLVAEAA